MENVVCKGKDRFEVINGKIIMMSPRPAINHNRVIVNISAIFKAYLKGKRCEVFSDGVDVHLDEKNTVIPDAMIICNKEIIKGKGIWGAPDLIVEVLSPSTARKDRGYKKILYEKHGVKEYWLVDVIGRSVEVCLLKDGKFELDNVYTVYPEKEWEEMTDEEKAETLLSFHVSLYDDFVIDIREIFENVD